MSDNESRKKSAASARVSREFNAFSFLWRFVAALVLVFATYNPGGYSYYHWLRFGLTDGELGPEHFVVGVVLVIGWMILLGATQRSLGGIGVFLVAALLGGLVWLGIDLGVLSLETASATTWVVLVCVALALAVGLSWSHVWRRLTGQFEVDDSDD